MNQTALEICQAQLGNSEFIRLIAATLGITLLVVWVISETLRDIEKKSVEDEKKSYLYLGKV